jgi:hypothetical protein
LHFLSFLFVCMLNTRWYQEVILMGSLFRDMGSVHGGTDYIDIFYMVMTYM